MDVITHVRDSFNSKSNSPIGGILSNYVNNLSNSALREKLEHLYKVKKNQNRMLRDRGFIDYFSSDISLRPENDRQLLRVAPSSENDYIGGTLDDFIINYIESISFTYFQWILELAGISQDDYKNYVSDLNNMMTNMYIHPETGKRIFIYYAQDRGGKDIVGDNVKRFITLTEKLDIRNAIFISQTKIHTDAKGLIEQKLLSYHIQTFLFDNLMYIPIDHFLVPQHIGLSKEESNQHMIKNNLTMDQMQKILITDPIVKYYDFEEGSVIKIVRRIPYSQSSVALNVTFRVVYRPVL